MRDHFPRPIIYSFIPDYIGIIEIGRHGLEIVFVLSSFVELVFKEEAVDCELEF